VPGNQIVGAGSTANDIAKKIVVFKPVLFQEANATRDFNRVPMGQ